MWLIAKTSQQLTYSIGLNNGTRKDGHERHTFYEFQVGADFNIRLTIRLEDEREKAERYRRIKTTTWKDLLEGEILEELQDFDTPQWDRAATDGIRASMDELPPGWEARANPSGVIYYVDHNTRTTTLTHPRAR